jgi:hypothetical protein
MKNRNLGNLSPPPLLNSLSPRQNEILSIPATYATLNNSPEPGVVVGIVLGVVGAIVFILYILWSTTSFFGISEEGVVDDGTIDDVTVIEEVVRRSPRTRRPNRRSTVVDEVVEVRERPHRRREHDETIIVEEESVSTRTRSDDVVEVIEEPSTIASRTPSPRPRRSGRHSGSYRRVDPYEYGGGGRRYRK